MDVIEIQPLGLKNMMSYCYLNSLLQSLVNCNAFVRIIKKHESHNTITKILSAYISAVERQTSDLVHQYPVMLLNNLRKLSHSQESASDALRYLIEEIKLPAVDELFTARYIDKIYCGICGKVFSIKESSSIQIFLFDKVDMCIRGVSNHIMSSKSTLTDYKPESTCCSSPLYIQLHTNVHLPELLCCTYNAYGISDDILDVDDNDVTKTMLSPKSLKINGYRYNKKSEILHSGTLQDGHYISKIHKNKIYLADDDNIFIVSEDNDPLSQYNRYMKEYKLYISFYEVQ